MFSAATKNYLKSTIRQTDSYNRMLEVEEMWKTKHAKEMQKGKGDEKRMMKMRGAYMDKEEETMPCQSGNRASPSSKRSTYWMRALQKAEEEHGDRWGHAGYREMYPGDFISSYSSSEEESSSKVQHSRRQKRKSRSHKEKKRKKKDKKKSKKHKDKTRLSDSEDSDSICGPKPVTNDISHNSSSTCTNNDITYGPQPPPDLKYIVQCDQDKSLTCDDSKPYCILNQKHGKRYRVRSSESDSDCDKKQVKLKVHLKKKKRKKHKERK